MTPSASRRGPRSSSTFSGPLSTVQYDVNGVRFDMVRVPPGRFIDGEGETRRELLVSRPFEIGVAPVTPALWRAVMGSNPSRFQGEDRPVERVSWDDTQRFMVAMVKHGFPGFRLPTEAEWAWAARCGVSTRWAGAERVKAVPGSIQTAPVAGLSGVAVGAFDFLDNVQEWAGDHHEWVPLAGVDVQGPVLGSYRINRGGGQHRRLANRVRNNPVFRDFFLGFRLLRSSP